MELLLPVLILCLVFIVAVCWPARPLLYERCLTANEEVGTTSDETLAQWSLPRLLTARDKLDLLQRHRCDHETGIRRQLQRERVAAALEQRQSAICYDEQAKAQCDPTSNRNDSA